MNMAEEFGQVATMQDAVREWVLVVGADRPDQAWVLHDYDVWVKNPYYHGAPVPHPEDDPRDDFVPDVSEARLLEIAESEAAYAAMVDDDCPF